MLLVYGGAFNPITKAHYKIAKLLISKYTNNFLFVPVGNSYGKPELISFNHRFNMVSIIAKELNAKVSAAEDKEDYSGTYDLLCNLKKEENDIYFVLGADNLINLDKWINYDKLIKEFKFIVLTRDNIEVDLSKYDSSRFEVININFDISSSNYRKNKNENIIDNKVLMYIKENNLY